MESLSLQKPHLIIMVGIPGSGKSFFAEHFAKTFKAPIISFNRLRNELFNDPTFDKDEDEIINRIADYMLEETFKTGRTVIYEGLSDQRSNRAAIAKKARDAGYEPMFIWVQTEHVTAQKRATKSISGIKPLTPAQFESKIKQFSLPHISEKPIVISGKHTYTSQLKIVLKNLVPSKAPAAIQPETPPQHRNRNILIR